MSHTETYEAGVRAGREQALRMLAGAMKKVLPPALLKEVVDHCDPLSAFIKELGEVRDGDR